MIRTLLAVLLFMTLFLPAQAQYFQFSQYNFTGPRVNPASVALTDYASASFIYRHQSTGSDFAISSSMFSASYPLLNRKTKQRWGGLGITMLDDRSGTAGIFTTQEATASYASSIFISKRQSIALGVKALYQWQQVNPSGLYTGSQYVPNRGFDETIFSGEIFETVRTDFFTLSLGAFWQKTDRKNNRIAYLGLSFFDFNKPNNSFFGRESQLNTTAVVTAGVQVYQKGSLSIMPEILYTRSSANNTINIGFISRYLIPASGNSNPLQLAMITKYVLGRSGILGLQLIQENFSVGFSYDFPVFESNPGNLGAFEVGIELRQLVRPRFKNKLSKRKGGSIPPSVRPRPVIPSGQQSDKPIIESQSATAENPSSGSNQVKPVLLKEELKQKQDSVLAMASAGDILHEPLVIDRFDLHFNFDFNSVSLDEKSLLYLDQLAEAFKENERLIIKLTGHTDNIGSNRYNDRLSLQRAETIKSILIEQGVDEERILTEGKGMREPLNGNETETERSKNRRVEVTIVYQ
ncbi:MAG: PorP/SprF family type IX secretion system membrane protein [Cyclobacteriaceae bacterium]|nr:PorP/SprF family type IX secretion system membrane protein [Cyclobacteriaceae bacterium]